jgi:hypothetical protein
MIATKENVLYGPVSDYFLEQGFFVLSGAPKPQIVGTSEFGVKIEDRDQYETVDVLAVRWGENKEVYSIAVECKLYATPRESAGASLNQVTDYQLFFDEVYAGTQSGSLKDKESVLRSLGVGHISVDLRSKKAKSLFPAQFRNAERFDSIQNATQVAPRVVLPLIFKDIFGLPLRYMDASHGGLWVAKDIVSRVQFNAGGSDKDGETYFAVNIEFIDDLRSIVKRVDRVRLTQCLRALGNKYTVTLGIDQIRTDRRVSEPIKSPATSVDVNDLLRKIEKEVTVPASGTRKSKPHLTISTLLYEWDEPLTRDDYTSKTRQAIDTLTPLMEVFNACF